LIAFPDFEEQEKIADYIDGIVRAVDNIVADYEKQIEQLHEMKHRVILDVVTGGLDVREALIPNYEFVEEDEDTDSEEVENEDEVAEEQED